MWIFSVLFSGAEKVLAHVAAAIRLVHWAVWTHLSAVLFGGAVALVLMGRGGPAPGEAELRPSVLSPDRPTYSPLARLRLYERPGSTRVDTVRVPASVEAGKPLSGDPSSENGLNVTPGLSGSAAQLFGEPSGQLGTPALGYVIVPLRSGRPALDIEDEVGTLSAYSPRTGRGVQYQYDICDPVLQVGPVATIGIGLPGPKLRSIGAGLTAEAGRFRATVLGGRAQGKWAGTIRLTAQRLFTAID